MKKLLNYVLIFQFLLTGLLFSDKVKVGKVIEIKGKVEAVDTESGKIIVLKKGNSFFSNMTIKTSHQSEILLEFNNGIQRLISSNSQFMIKGAPAKNLEDKTFEEIQKMVMVGGVKASNQDKNMVWKDGDQAGEVEKKKKQIQWINLKFEEKKYYEIIKEIKKDPGLEKNNQLWPVIAFSYFQLGLFEKSRDIFEKISDPELSNLGLFLCWIEIGDTETAKKYYLKLSPTANYYDKLGAMVEKR